MLEALDSRGIRSDSSEGSNMEEKLSTHRAVLRTSSDTNYHPPSSSSSSSSSSLPAGRFQAAQWLLVLPERFRQRQRVNHLDVRQRQGPGPRDLHN
ncbi:uncharacterized protein V6R79_019487 [Siganus canaliculatus]